MSKIDELIQRLCPNGVEYKALEEVLDYEQPSKYIVKNTDYDDSFQTPVLTAGQSFILGYTDETESIYNASKENPTIIFDDFTTSFHWVDFDFKIKSSAMKMLRPKSETGVFRYIYYAMCCINYEPADHSRHWISKYSKFTIPFPPVEVQEEIVRILDKFTTMSEKLNIELELRKKQYEYYRERLFEEVNKQDIIQRIGDVAFISTGATPKTSIKEYWDNGTIPWMSSGEVNKKRVYETEQKITQKGYDSCSTKMIPKDTVVVALAGQGKTRGLVALTKIDLCTNQSLCSILPKEGLNNSYLYYYLSGQYQNLRQISSGDGTRGGLNLKMVSSYPVPVPSLAEQEHIVSILDKFDTLINDQNKGLPAEIRKVQQQYEFYRDKLLTF